MAKSYIQSIEDNMAAFEAQCPKCADVALYLLEKDVSASMSEIRDELNESPERYLDILQKKSIISKDGSNYKLTGAGKVFAKTVEIHRKGGKVVPKGFKSP